MPVQALALFSAASAIVLGIRSLVAEAGERSPCETSRKSLLHQGILRVSHSYDASRRGRRLRARLWQARIDLSPSSWRCAQLFVTVPATTLLLTFGLTLPAAAGGALSVSRLGGRAVLWLRRGCARRALDDAAPALARALATELAAWGSGMQAISSAARRCRGTPVASRVLELAAARVALGGEPARSLRRALDQAEPRLRDTSPALTVAAIFGLYRFDSAATAAALDRLASALEDDRTVRREAHAAVGEVRTSAVAVPAIAAATGAMLLSADPPALVAALSWPLFPLLLAAGAVVIAAAVVARRLVAV